MPSSRPGSHDHGTHSSRRTNVPVRSAARVDTGTGSIAWKRVAGVQAGDRPLIVWIADANGRHAHRLTRGYAGGRKSNGLTTAETRENCCQLDGVELDRARRERSGRQQGVDRGGDGVSGPN